MGLCFSKKNAEEVKIVINAVDEALEALDNIIDEFTKDTKEILLEDTTLKEL